MMNFKNKKGQRKKKISKNKKNNENKKKITLEIIDDTINSNSINTSEQELNIINKSFNKEDKKEDINKLTNVKNLIEKESYKCYICELEFTKRHYFQNHLVKNHNIKSRLKDFIKYVKDYEDNLETEINRRISKIKHLFKESMIIFDIGCGKGNFTEKLLQLGNNSIYHLFEPVKKFYDLSSEKFENNRNIFINNFALSNNNSKESINKSYGSKNFGVNSYVKNLKLSNVSVEDTIMITLDQYFKYNKIKSVDFMIIDTDGYEANVLEGFLTTLKNIKVKPYILIKLKWGSNHPNWVYCKNIFNEIVETGYFNKNFDNVKNNSYVLFEPIKI